MSNWKRPHDFEDLIEDQAGFLRGEWQDEGFSFRERQAMNEAFLSGALYAALIAEGRAP